MSGESGDCDIRIWICSKENVQGKKEPGTYCCCGGSGDFDNGVDFTWLCCQVHRKCHGNQQGGCGRTVRNTAVAQCKKNLEEDWIRGYSYVQIDLHPDIYRVGFSYYADRKRRRSGEKKAYMAMIFRWILIIKLR